MTGPPPPPCPAAAAGPLGWLRRAARLTGLAAPAVRLPGDADAGVEWLRELKLDRCGALMALSRHVAISDTGCPAMPRA